MKWKEVKSFLQWNSSAARGPAAITHQTINFIQPNQRFVFIHLISLLDLASAPHAWPALFSIGAPLRIRPQGEEEQAS